jgi:hypothetical protein
MSLGLNEVVTYSSVLVKYAVLRALRLAFHAAIILALVPRVNQLQSFSNIQKALLVAALICAARSKSRAARIVRAPVAKYPRV